MTDEELLMGDDAIHGEIAYYMAHDVEGIIPDAGIVVGRDGGDLEAQGSSGSGSSSPGAKKHHVPSQEVKME